MAIDEYRGVTLMPPSIKDLMNASLLSDEDKIKVFDMALQVARDTGKDFYDVLRITINEYVNSKFKGIGKKYVELRDTQEDTKDDVVTTEPKESAETKQDDTIDSKEVTMPISIDEFRNKRVQMAIDEANEERLKLLDDIMKMKDLANNGISVSQFIVDARNGVIDDDKHFDIDYYNMNGIESKQFAEKLKRLNELSRKVILLTYETMSDEELDALREKEIANYEEVVRKLTEYNHEFKDPKTDATTLTFEQLVGMNRNDGAYRIGGTEANGFDDMYYKANQFANKPGYEEMSMKTFKEVLEAVAKKIEELKNMDTLSFKHYKEGQMKFKNRYHYLAEVGLIVFDQGMGEQPIEQGRSR